MCCENIMFCVCMCVCRVGLIPFKSENGHAIAPLFALNTFANISFCSNSNLDDIAIDNVAFSSRYAYSMFFGKGFSLSF